MTTAKCGDERTSTMKSRLCRRKSTVLALVTAGMTSVSIAAEKDCYLPLRPDGGTVYGGNYQVCRDYIQVLNSVCSPPPTLLCDEAFPNKIGHFSAVRWEALDPRLNLPLIEQIVRSGWKRKADQDEGWRSQQANIQAVIAEGKAVLRIASIDVDRDGVADTVAKFAVGDCKSAATALVVLAPDRTRIDPKKTAVTRQIGLKSLFKYDEAAYLLTWEERSHGDSRLRIWEGYSTAHGSRSQIVCEFSKTP